jgi:hypothetical protein
LGWPDTRPEIPGDEIRQKDPVLEEESRWLQPMVQIADDQKKSALAQTQSWDLLEQKIKQQN